MEFSISSFNDIEKVGSKLVLSKSWGNTFFDKLTQVIKYISNVLYNCYIYCTLIYLMLQGSVTQNYEAGQWLPNFLFATKYCYWSG